MRSNYSIDLKLANGAKAEQLQAGKYTIEVRDQTKDHNFHLTGPGLTKTTTVPFVGTTKWTVDLKPGTYRFVCDPHAPLMKGSFTVTAGPPKQVKLKVSSLRVSKAGRKVVVKLALNKKATGQIRLLRKARPVVAMKAALKTGSNVKRLRLPARAKRGLYRVQVIIMDAGKRHTFTRPVRF